MWAQEQTWGWFGCVCNEKKQKWIYQTILKLSVFGKEQVNSTIRAQV